MMKTQETDEKPKKIEPEDPQGHPETSQRRPETLKYVLTITQLASAGMKKYPTTEAEIPDHLYTGGLRHKCAKIMIFEGVQDTKTLVERTGLTAKTVANVRRDVSRVAAEVMRARGVPPGKPDAPRQTGVGVVQSGAGRGADVGPAMQFVRGGNAGKSDIGVQDTSIDTSDRSAASPQHGGTPASPHHYGMTAAPHHYGMTAAPHHGTADSKRERKARQ